MVIVTPDGQIARYFYGIDFPPKELESELERARAGRIGTPIGRLLLALLRLRRGDRQVHAVDLAADPDPGNGDRGRAWRAFMFLMFRREGKQRRMNQYRTMSRFGRRNELDRPPMSR